MNALRKANEQLKEIAAKSNDIAMLDAELLLAKALDVKKTWLFTHFDTELTKEQLSAFEDLLERRQKFEPMAYLLQKQAFYGRDFKVNPSVLIPRPATETMVELALKRIGEGDQEETLIADIGTGSGAIGITLAAESGQSVLLTDVSEDALDIARENIGTYKLEEQIEVLHGDLFIPIADIFGQLKTKNISMYRDLVICANLPYLTEAQRESLQEEVKYEPESALFAGKDGLDDYWQLLRQIRKARSILPLHLTLFMEIDPLQKEKITELILNDFPQAKPEIIRDLSDLDRIVRVDL